MNAMQASSYGPFPTVGPRHDFPLDQRIDSTRAVFLQQNVSDPLEVKAARAEQFAPLVPLLENLPRATVPGQATVPLSPPLALITRGTRQSWVAAPALAMESLVGGAAPALLPQPQPLLPPPLPLPPSSVDHNAPTAAYPPTHERWSSSDSHTLHGAQLPHAPALLPLLPPTLLPPSSVDNAPTTAALAIVTRHERWSSDSHTAQGLFHTAKTPDTVHTFREGRHSVASPPVLVGGGVGDGASSNIAAQPHNTHKYPLHGPGTNPSRHWSLVPPHGIGWTTTTTTMPNPFIRNKKPPRWPFRAARPVVRRRNRQHTIENHTVYHCIQPRGDLYNGDIT
jgi:hypothetical protein